MFENFFPYPFLDIIVRYKVSVLPCIFYVVIVSLVVKVGVFYAIVCGNTKNWMVLFDLNQDWLLLLVMYKTCMTHINIMNHFQW